MSHELPVALVEAELAPALIAQIEGIVTDASTFNEVAPDHPEGWTAVDIELDELRKARTALNSDDAAEILRLSGESELAQKALLTKIMEPDTVDRLRDIADWAVDSLEDIQEKFPKKEPYIVPDEGEIVTILDKIEDEVNEQWENVDLETKRELQAAAMDSLPLAKKIAAFGGAIEDPTIDQYREVLTLQLEEKTRLNISRMYLTPEQMLQMWSEVRNEKTAEKIIRKVSELDFDAETMMRIGLSLTMVATLAAGPELANAGESTGAISMVTHPSAQIVKGHTTTLPTNGGSATIHSGSVDTAGNVKGTVSSPLPTTVLNPKQVSSGTPTPTEATPTPVAPAPAPAAPETTTVPTTAPAPEVAPVTTTPPSEAPKVVTPAPAPAPAPAPEVAATPEAATPPPYTAEKYVIGVLKLLAQKQGIPESDTVTQEHINGLLAWGWLEEGDLGNTGYYNLFNSGWDDPKLLATAHRADGVQAFNSFDNGVLATTETMLGSNQNRIAKLLSDPNVTAEQFFEGMTYYQRYPGNTYWAQADSDVTLDGITYTQAGYLEDLQTRYQAVMSDYAKHAGILMGNGYAIDKGLYAPATALEFTGTGPVAPPAPPVTAPPAPTTKNKPVSGKPPRYKHSKRK